MGATTTNILRPTTLAVAGGSVVLGALVGRWLRGRRSEFEPPAVPVVDTSKPPPAPLWEGGVEDPAGIALVSELDGYLVRKVGSRVVPTDRLVYLPQGGSKKRAIPARSLWPNMAATLYYVARLLRPVSGGLEVRSAYRPGWYNAQVGGASNSLHRWFAALDLRAADKNKTVAMVERAAQLYVTQGARLRMGFGVYGSPPKRIHVDVGWKRRTWENADEWVQKVSIT